MAVRAAVKLGKSLFDYALEAGYKTADDGLLPLRDSGVMVQAKKGPAPRENPNFDEERWLELYPRPSDPKKMASWYTKLSRARKIAGTDGRDSLGVKPDPRSIEIKHFDKAAWEKQNPDPFPGQRRNLTGQDAKDKERWRNDLERAKRNAERSPERYDSLGNLREGVGKAEGRNKFESELRGWDAEYAERYPPEDFFSLPLDQLTPEQLAARKLYTQRSHIAKQRAGSDGFDDFGDALPEDFGSFNAEEYDRLNPRPDADSKSNEAARWRQRRSRAIERANSEGYDSLGNRLEPDWGSFNAEEWGRLHPQPPIGDPNRQRWFDERKRIAKRANSEGYDPLGRRETPETTIETEFTPAQRRNFRTPPWADRDGLLEINNIRQQMEIDSGIKMEADHATPLLGKYVSGLNLPQNIQFLPQDYHRQFSNQVGVGKNSLFSTPEANANRYTDHLAYITENADDIAYRQREKAKLVKGFSERLSHDILSPHTKVGRNARKLWGDDTQKHLDYYRKELGLLGV